MGAAAALESIGPTPTRPRPRGGGPTPARPAPDGPTPTAHKKREARRPPEVNNDPALNLPDAQQFELQTVAVHRPNIDAFE